MHAFHIQYRNTQGTLMRILTAVSRRALDVHYIRAAASGNGYRADILLDVTPKQIGQLCRDWDAIVDVTDVKYGAPSSDLLEALVSGPHPPVSATAGGQAGRCSSHQTAARGTANPSGAPTEPAGAPDRQSDQAAIATGPVGHCPDVRSVAYNPRALP